MAFCIPSAVGKSWTVGWRANLVTTTMLSVKASTPGRDPDMTSSVVYGLSASPVGKLYPQIRHTPVGY